VLSTASDLFYRKGFRAVGVDTVVSESAVAKMTLYKHFPSKDSLIVAVLEAQSGAFRAWLGKCVEERAGNARGRLVALFDVLGEWFSSEGYQGDACLNAAVELRDPSHPAWKAILAHTSWLRGYIGALVEQAELSEPESTADALYLLVQGAIVGAQLGSVARSASAAGNMARVLIEARAERARQEEDR